MSQSGITRTTAIEIPAELSQQQREALYKFSAKGLEAMCKVTILTEIPAEMSAYERDVAKNLFKSNTSIAVRRYCRELREQKLLEGDQMPVAMVLDSAKVKGASLFASEKECVVQDNEGKVVVPASRVPVHPCLHGQQRVPAGIDVVALTIGASTRWTGTEVAVTLPVDTLNRFMFTYIAPAAVKDVLLEIPKPESNTKNGMRGRRWAYEVYTQLAKMPPVKFYELASEWYQSLYRLPAPGKPLDQVRAMVFGLTTIPFQNGTKQIYVPKDGFKSLSHLREVRGGFPTVLTLPDMYSQYVEFASVQQGEGSGIGMVATPIGSWGLGGITQVTCERLTSYIVASPCEKIVLAGLGYAEVMWIHHSVKKHRPDQVVYELVASIDASETLFKTADTRKSLMIKVGSTQLHASAGANKINNIKVYDPSVVRPRVWDHVVNFLTADYQAASQVFYGAFMPPENEDAYQYVAMHKNIWNTCGFVMKRGTKVQVSRFIFDEKQGTSIRKVIDAEASFLKGFAHVITDPTVWYKQFTMSMNAALTMWGVPSVNNDFGYFNHMAPYNTSGRYKVRQVYNASEDDYYVAYDEVVVSTPLSVTTTTSATPIVSDPAPQQAPDPSLVLPDLLDFGNLLG